jgi:hypothetical protein
MLSGTTRKDSKHTSWPVTGPTWIRGNCLNVEGGWNHGNTNFCPTTCDTKDVIVGGEDLIITLGLSKKTTLVYTTKCTKDNS